MRVSSSQQDTRSQEADLKTWAAGQGEKVQWFRDTFTGHTMERPGWQKLWAGVEAGKIDRIVIWRLDRLGRTSLGLIKLRDELVARKIRIHSLRDSIDLETPSGRLTWGIIVAVSEYESEVRKERQLAGIAVARERHGGKCPWGGRKRGTRIKLSLERERLARELKSKGETVTSIARVLGLSRKSIYVCLKRAAG
jgi:DNA invertase Pin-like site-specific DNA recombinase